MNKVFLYSFYVIFLFLGMHSPAKSFVKYDNLTGDDTESIKKRTKIIKKKDNQGIRLAWDGMKEMNKEYLQGTVDISVKEFENNMISKFDSQKFKMENPDIKVEINKMDFKGYYITCTPSPQCTNQVSKVLNSLPPGKLQKLDEAGNIIKKTDFNLIPARSPNYNQGYIEARTIAAYPEYKKNLKCNGKDCKKLTLNQFIDKKLKEALKEATGTSDIGKINKKDPKFMSDLQNIVKLTRAGKEIPEDKKHLLKLKSLVTALDILLETPFKNSNNLDEELKKAINSKVQIKAPKKFAISTAISGDDLFIIVKDKNSNILKVVGADAKGLGVTNMSTRYEEVLDQYKKGGINSMDDIFSLSDKATNSADTTMKESIDKYILTMEDSLNHANTSTNNLTGTLERAHKKYHEKTLKPGSKLMQMRIAAIPLCGKEKSNQCIMDTIAIIHNLLKKMEAAGHNGHFGDSCIGTFYWLKRMKIDI